MNQFILNAIQTGGYAGIFLLMALENIFPPVPSEIIMGYGGVLVARGTFSFWPLLLIGTLGTVAGNCVWYWLGWRWSEQQLQAFVDRRGRWLTLEWEDFEKARLAFRKHGDWVVFLLRFSPFLRTIVSLPAGLAHMKMWRFLLFTFLGSLIWNGLLIWGGGKLSGLIEQYDAAAGYVVGGIIFAGLLWYGWRVANWKPRSER